MYHRQVKYYLRRLLFSAVFAGLVFGYHFFQDGQLHTLLYGDGTTAKAKGIRDIDGNTILVDKDGKPTYVRFIGISTIPRACGEAQAAARLSALISGKKITLKTDPAQGSSDQYGRMLAYVYLPNGHTAQELQLRAGLAQVHGYDQHSFQLEDKFKTVQSQARSAHKGVWGPPCNGDFHK